MTGPLDGIAKLIELMDAISDLKQELAVVRVERDGATERGKLLLEAKNLWMERATAAEARLRELAQAVGA